MVKPFYIRFKIHRKIFEKNGMCKNVLPLVFLYAISNMCESIKHIATKIGASERLLWQVADNIDIYYYEARQPKRKYGEIQKDNKGIKYRDLLPSIYPLKGIQENLNFFLQQIELPLYAYGSVKGANNILNAMEHLGNKYFFSVDLKDFFSNITHHQVFKMFRQNKFSPLASRLLTKLTTYRGGLPQGAPTSPIISNLVFVETGKKIMELIKDHQITFTSYLDDLTFSSKVDFKFLTHKILEILKEDRFYLHHKKIHYKIYMPEVTGLFIYKNRLLTLPAMKKRAEKSIHVANYLRTILWYENYPVNP